MWCLPGIDVEEFLREERDDDGAVGELTTGQCLERLLRRLGVCVLDEDLADARIDTGSARAGDLDVYNLSVLAALLLDILFDFCDVN
jgi:hypothetical protein